MDQRGRAVRVAVGVTVLVFALFFLAVLALVKTVERGDFLGLGKPRVGLLEVEGIILDADEATKQLQDFLNDPSIRAIVVRINSPGGVVAPTQEIYRALNKTREKGKPVVASMGSVAASGGYYIASAADSIYANPGTLTGSIGVIMQISNLGGLLKKVGVRFEVVKAGRHKDIGSFAREMTSEERRILQNLLDDVYEQFVEAIATGRKLEKERVRELADGRIFTGRQAKEAGLIDNLGDLEDAIAEAGRRGGIPDKPKVYVPRRRFSIIDLLRNWGNLRSISLMPSRLDFPKVPLFLME